MEGIFNQRKVWQTDGRTEKRSIDIKYQPAYKIQENQPLCGGGRGGCISVFVYGCLAFLPTEQWCFFPTLILLFTKNDTGVKTVSDWLSQYRKHSKQVPRLCFSFIIISPFILAGVMEHLNKSTTMIPYCSPVSP